MKKMFWMVLSAAVLLLSGCTTPYIADLDNHDLRETAGEMLQSLIRSGRLDRSDGNAYVMTIGEVKNDTQHRFDTDTLTSYITEELMNSGKVMITSAMAATADNRDVMVNAVRSVRGNAEFNQSTVAKAGQLVAPTHSIYGKIIQHDVRKQNGDKEIEYYFQLRIVELASGLQWWQKQHVIGKRAIGPNIIYR